MARGWILQVGEVNTGECLTNRTNPAVFHGIIICFILPKQNVKTLPDGLPIFSLNRPFLETLLSDGLETSVRTAYHWYWLTRRQFYFHKVLMIFWVYDFFLGFLILCIVRKLGGGGSLAVAVGVGDRWQVTYDMFFFNVFLLPLILLILLLIFSPITRIRLSNIQDFPYSILSLLFLISMFKDQNLAVYLKNLAKIWEKKIGPCKTRDVWCGMGW